MATLLVNTPRRPQRTHHRRGVRRWGEGCRQEHEPLSKRAARAADDPLQGPRKGDAGVGQCGQWSLEGRAEWRVNTVPQAARSQALPPASMASTPNLQLTVSEHNFPTQRRQLWALLD